MLKMNYWTDKWDLHEDVCPCDVHFNDWMAKEKLKNKTIYHFGTGTHHVIGIKQAAKKNRVFAITASKEEYETYVETRHRELGRREKLSGLFRRHLPHQPDPAARIRRGDDVPPVRIFLPQYRE